MGSVAIDVDHIPLYTFAPGFIVSGRPPTHSLITVLALMIAAVLLKVIRILCLGLPWVSACISSATSRQVQVCHCSGHSQRAR
jgi:hypothetical protein